MEKNTVRVKGMKSVISVLEIEYNHEVVEVSRLFKHLGNCFSDDGSQKDNVEKNS